MQDVSRGTFEQRAAAYRHNRTMRNQLLARMGHWAISSGAAILLTSYLQSFGASGILAPLAVAGGLFATAGICILTVGTCAYLHLTCDQR
jgi:amino acid transporter